MKPWHAITLMTLPVLLFAALWIWHTEKERNAPVKLPNVPEQRPITQDETVVPRKLFIDSLKSAQVLVGKPAWMQAGYQVEYFPAKGGHIDFAHQVGVLPPIQELDIKQVVAQSTPASFHPRIGRGDKNIFVLFTEPGKPDEYAAPFGTIGGPSVDAAGAAYYFDDLLFYDDPHKLYSFWPASVWKAIDNHKVIPGMNEMQATMSLGQIQNFGSSDYGNRTVGYDYGEHNEKRASITFEHNKATEIKAD
jgi:hypothetical protein